MDSAKNFDHQLRQYVIFQRIKKNQSKVAYLKYKLQAFDGENALHPKGKDATQCIACKNQNSQAL